MKNIIEKSSIDWDKLNIPKKMQHLKPSGFNIFTYSNNHKSTKFRGKTVLFIEYYNDKNKNIISYHKSCEDAERLIENFFLSGHKYKSCQGWDWSLITK